MATLKFGNKAPAAKTTIVEEKVKSQFWVNVGYTIQVNGEDVFVSLPIGIPLDSIKELPTNTRNDDYNKLNQARNQLLQDMISSTDDLEPGEHHIGDGLEVQIRRVDKEADPLPAITDNPFIRKVI